MTPAPRWHRAARRLIDAGVTQKDVSVVALVLSEQAAGTGRAPSVGGGTFTTPPWVESWPRRRVRGDEEADRCLPWQDGPARRPRASC